MVVWDDWSEGKCTYAHPIFIGGVGLHILTGVPGHSGGLDSLIPTKTSRFVVQSVGNIDRSEMMGDQVFSIFFFGYSLLLAFASLQSMLSLFTMAFFHLVVITVFFRRWPPIMWSHQSVQIRYVDSEIMMCFSLASPRCLTVGVSSLFVFGVIFPHPRMWPMVGAVQFACASGQVCRTRFHMVEGHSVRMCSSDSIVFSQLVHFAHGSRFGMLFQKSPICRDPTIARYRKCCISRLISGCFRLFQRDSLVPRLLVMSRIACHMMSRFISVCPV